VSGVYAVDVATVSKDQLKADRAKSTVQIIDVRTEGDWASSPWKIQGAVREDPSEVDKWMSKYSKDSTIVLYCA
jgi:rhodanese-related sulfurtransferase